MLQKQYFDFYVIKKTSSKRLFSNKSMISSVIKSLCKECRYSFLSAQILLLSDEVTMVVAFQWKLYFYRHIMGRERGV